MYSPEIIELIKASRAMLDGKGWHEIDGDCSICSRFRKAVEVAENTVQIPDVCITCPKCGNYHSVFITCPVEQKS